jgi:CheY-like chemotaxis protein
MPINLLLSDDLIFVSRIVGTARALGIEMKSVRGQAELLAQASNARCVLVDLHNPGLDIDEVVRTLKIAGKPFIVGYGSHVDTGALKKAREAGCNLVLPRSKFVEVLEAELPAWCASC